MTGFEKTEVMPEMWEQPYMRSSRCWSEGESGLEGGSDEFNIKYQILYMLELSCFHMTAIQ